MYISDSNFCVNIQLGNGKEGLKSATKKKLEQPSRKGYKLIPSKSNKVPSVKKLFLNKRLKNLRDRRDIDNLPYCSPAPDHGNGDNFIKCNICSRSGAGNTVVFQARSQSRKSH